MTDSCSSDCRLFCLALVQLAPVVGDSTHNLASIERWTERAAAKGAQMVCFPELSVCGYSRNRVEELAEPLPGPASRFLAKLARKCGMAVSAGLIEKAGPGCYITQLVVSGDGTIQRYRKTHLGSREREVFRAGDELPVFSVFTRDGMSVELAIGLCYDVHFPGLAATCAVRGAQLLLAPHAAPHNGIERLKLWQRYMGARAYDNTMYVAACNHVQKLGCDEYSGGIGVWDYRTGELLDHWTEAGEGILFSDLDLHGVSRTRAQGRVFYLRDSRPELYR